MKVPTAVTAKSVVAGASPETAKMEGKAAGDAENGAVETHPEMAPTSSPDPGTKEAGGELESDPQEGEDPRVATRHPSRPERENDQGAQAD